MAKGKSKHGVRTVLLRSDMAGEDCAYTMGAVELGDDQPTETFEKEATAIMDEIRVQGEYDDEDLLTALKERGYKIVDAPEEILVRY